MNATEWGVVATIGAAALTGIAGSIVHAVKVSYRFGGMDERIKNQDREIAKLEARADAADQRLTGVAALGEAIRGLEKEVAAFRSGLTRELDEIKGNVKSLFGRTTPARRRARLGDEG